MTTWLYIYIHKISNNIQFYWGKKTLTNLQLKREKKTETVATKK